MSEYHEFGITATNGLGTKVVRKGLTTLMSAQLECMRLSMLDKGYVYDVCCVLPGQKVERSSLTADLKRVTIGLHRHIHRRNIADR